MIGHLVWDFNFSTFLSNSWTLHLQWTTLNNHQKVNITRKASNNRRFWDTGLFFFSSSQYLYFTTTHTHNFPFFPIQLSNFSRSLGSMDSLQFRPHYCTSESEWCHLIQTFNFTHGQLCWAPETRQGVRGRGRHNHMKTMAKLFHSCLKEVSDIFRRLLIMHTHRIKPRSMKANSLSRAKAFMCQLQEIILTGKLLGICFRWWDFK